jgi:hypothetical protein
MKVMGRDEDVSVDEYANLVADEVRKNVRNALAHQGADGVVPDPISVAASMGDLIYLADESPNELAALLGPFWSSTKVRSIFGATSRQALADRRKHGSVLGLKTSDNDVVYPVFQFHQHDGRVEVRPALVSVLRILKAFDPWTVAVFLRTPAPELGALTPLDWARKDHDSAALIDLAHNVAREWSAA